MKTSRLQLKTSRVQLDSSIIESEGIYRSKVCSENREQVEASVLKPGSRPVSGVPASHLTHVLSVLLTPPSPVGSLETAQLVFPCWKQRSRVLWNHEGISSGTMKTMSGSGDTWRY